MNEGDLDESRKLQAARRLVDGQTEGHLKRAERATDAVGAEWIDRAACATSDLDPEAWFPRTPADNDTASLAKAICWNECSVRLECLQAACLRRDWGVWGGFSQTERLTHNCDYEVLKLIGSK
jgi:hypothetical protein